MMTILLAALALAPDPLAVSRLVVAQANQARKDEGRNPVVPNVKLTRVAQSFADFLAKTDRFDHDADGASPMERARRGGYRWCFVAENIAYEYRSSGFEADELAQAFVQDWLGSSGHRRNLLSPDVADTGVGIARSAKTGRYYAVQMLGRERVNGGC